MLLNMPSNLNKERELVYHVTEAFLWPAVQVLSVCLDPNSKLASKLKDTEVLDASHKTANKLPEHLMQRVGP